MPLTAVRKSTFETNSSSTSAFVWLSDEAYRKFAYEDYYLDLRDGGGVVDDGRDCSDRLIALEDIYPVIEELREKAKKDFDLSDERAAVLPGNELMMYSGVVAAAAERDREDWLDFEGWDAHPKKANDGGDDGWDVSVSWNDFTQMWEYEEYQPGKRNYW